MLSCIRIIRDLRKNGFKKKEKWFYFTFKVYKERKCKINFEESYYVLCNLTHQMYKFTLYFNLSHFSHKEFWTLQRKPMYLVVQTG